MTDWFLLLPAGVCAVATYVCGHETLAMTKSEGVVPVAGAVVTLACAIATLISIGAML